MNDCVEYVRLISAYVDGELSGDVKKRVEDHTAECGRCAALLEAYRELSHAVAETAVPAPDTLKNGVMAKIAEEPSPPVKNVNTVRTILTRYIPAAACIALILLAAPRLQGLGCSSSAPQYTSSTLMSGGSAVSDSAPAPEMSVADNDVTSSYSAENGDIDNGGNAIAPAEAPQGGGVFDSKNQTEPEETSAVPEREEIGNASITGASGGEGAEDGAVRFDYSGYYAVITVRGALPDGFEAFDKELLSDGTTRLFVTADMAQLLIDAGYDAELFDTGAGVAIVLWQG